MTLRQFYDWQTLGGGDDVAKLVAALEEKRHGWSINLKGKSKVSIQISTEELYRTFPDRSVPAKVHGILMRVAALEDTLAGKLAAYLEPQRRASKRLKDLTDIARLLETHPALQSRIPKSILDRLEA